MRTSAAVGLGLMLACVALGCSSKDAAEKPDDAGVMPSGGAGDTASGGAGDAASGGAGASGGRSGAGGAGRGGAGAPAAGSGGRAAGASGTADTTPPARPAVNPWGVAPSASSSRIIASWAPEIAGAGVHWVRGFDGSQPAMATKAAETNGLELSGILFMSDTGAADTTFPIHSLPAWQDYVKNAVVQTDKRVRYWEVWNEPPNFTENKSPADYAKIVISAYDAVKSLDPEIQVGLAAQSVNLNFLAQALDAGARDHFDYITVHPYETLGLVAAGGEAEYMSIVPTIRKLLADKNPAKRDAPVLFTELGEPVGGDVTPEHQADTLVKAFVMGIAQGALRVHWFEPLDGDSGPFGLIANGGEKRPSYNALASLIENLGEEPKYVGWLLLEDHAYAFVFEGPKGAALVSWAPPSKSQAVSFDDQVSVIQPGTAASTKLDKYTLTNSPVIVVGISAKLVDAARANLDQPFPWGGDYSSSTSVGYDAAHGEMGLHALGAASMLTIEGMPARDISKGPGITFTVDPNFNSYTPAKLRIEAVLRANDGSSGAGFNVKYESTSGFKGTGSWFNVPGSDKWYTQSWTIEDPQFVGKWGYHFSFDSDSTQHSGYSLASVNVYRE